MLNLIGKRFGSLKVESEAEHYVSPSGYVLRMWNCKCDCGGKSVVSTGHLRSGHTKSCGCQQFNGLVPRQAKSLVDERFGMLTVKKRLPNRLVGKDKISRVVYECECDCGRRTEVLALLLQQGSVKSCGCVHMSHGERVFDSILHDNNILHAHQYVFDDLRNDMDQVLRFDYALYMSHSLILIEIDGCQHKVPVEHFGGVKKFQRMILNDTLKNEYAERNGLKLIRFDTSKYESDEKLRKTFETVLLNEHIIDNPVSTIAGQAATRAAIDTQLDFR